MSKRKILLNIENDVAVLTNSRTYYYIDIRGDIVESHENSIASQKFAISAEYINVQYCERIAFYDSNGGTLLVREVRDFDFVKVPASASTMAICTRKNINDYFTKAKVYEVKETTPLYSDNAAVEYTKEADAQYFRQKVSGEFTFLRDDYDVIMSKPFDFIYRVQIVEEADYTTPLKTIARGKFTRTDCKINEVDKYVKTSLNNDDDYEEIIAGINNEYDLIKLDTEKKYVQMYRRPMLQIYSAGESVVNCFCGGTMFETDFEPMTDYVALNNLHFAKSVIVANVEVKDSDVYPSVINGKYTGTLTEYNVSEWRGTFIKGEARIIMKVTFTQSGVNMDCNVIYGGYTMNYNGSVTNGHKEEECIDQASWWMCYISFDIYSIFSRFVCDVPKIRGVNTDVIADGDPVKDNRNYTRCMGSSVTDIYVSQRLSDAPTDYGIAPNGKYYLPPDNYTTYYPIGRTSWGETSVWFSTSEYINIVDREARKMFVQRDFYTIGGAIKALLGEISSKLTHEETAEYSQFLYGNDPITGRKIDLVITPKSNVISGEYQQPAQKAMIHLSDILTALKNIYKVYWYIEDGKFKLEHISYFDNGGSYSYTPQIGVDTTSLMSRARVPWSFGADEYSFSKEDMSERYEFTWMDDVTTTFKGQAIEILSNYAKTGKKEDVNIPNFTSDIDFILLNPNAISMDGFVLIDAVEGNGILSPDTPYSGGSTGSTDILPRKEISTAFRGMNTTLIIDVSFSSTSTSTKTIYVNLYQGTNVLKRIPVSIRYGEQMPKSISINIPSECDNIGYSCAVGSATIRTYALRSPLVKSTEFAEMTIQGTEYVVQNGRLSMMYIQPRYWVYSMPAREMRINGYYTEANTLQRNKESSITFPCAEVPDMTKLVKTNIGNGAIEKMTINISSSAAQLILRYETE